MEEQQATKDYRQQQSKLVESLNSEHHLSVSAATRLDSRVNKQLPMQNIEQPPYEVLRQQQRYLMDSPKRENQTSIIAMASCENKYLQTQNDDWQPESPRRKLQVSTPVAASADIRENHHQQTQNDRAGLDCSENKNISADIDYFGMIPPCSCTDEDTGHGKGSGAIHLTGNQPAIKDLSSQSFLESTSLAKERWKRSQNGTGKLVTDIQQREKETYYSQ